jgi:hypothetical protein
VAETVDALGNRMTAVQNDYRALRPRVVADPNRNRSSVAFDALGLVAGGAVAGKPALAPAGETQSPHRRTRYRVGVFLGVASVIADQVDMGTRGDAAKNQLETLMLNAHVAPGATRAQVAQRITSWVRRPPSSLFRPLMEEFDKALLNTDRLPRQLTLEQQGHMWVARSATRVRLAS